MQLIECSKIMVNNLIKVFIFEKLHVVKLTFIFNQTLNQ
jgi:hypothetical protein